MKIIKFSENKDKLIALYRKGLPAGSGTGWASVDKHYTVGPSQFTTITGVPNHGKSEWLDALLVNLASNKLDGKPWKFLICSPENWPLEVHQAKILEKMIGKRFGIGISQRMTEQEITSTVDKVMDEHFEFIWLDDSETFADLLIGAREFCVKNADSQVGIVLDPWNQLEHCRPQHLTETEYISEALSESRKITRQTGAHLWIVAHPAKLFKDKTTGERPIPTPYDISGSAHWFNKSDNCITVWRDPQAQPGEDEYGVVQIHVQKIRFKHIGAPGLIRLRYDMATGRYEDTGQMTTTARKASDYKAARSGEPAKEVEF